MGLTIAVVVACIVAVMAAAVVVAGHFRYRARLSSQSPSPLRQKCESCGKEVQFVIDNEGWIRPRAKHVKIRERFSAVIERTVDTDSEEIGRIARSITPYKDATVEHVTRTFKEDGRVEFYVFMSRNLRCVNVAKGLDDQT